METNRLVKLAKEQLNHKQEALIGSASLGSALAALAANKKLKSNVAKAQRAADRSLSFQTYPTKHWMRQFEDFIGAERGVKINRKHKAKLAKLAVNSRRLSAVRGIGAAGAVAGLSALGAHSLYKKINKGA